MSAKFVYWWPNMGDNGEPIAIYRDDKGSDIGAETILESGQPIPLTPTFETWEKLVGQGLRCGLCWIETNGRHDQDRHTQLAHPIERIIARIGKDAIMNEGGI